MAFRQALEEEKDLRNQVWDSSGWGRPGMGCFSGKHRIFWGREVALGLRITDQAASLTSHGGHRSARWKDGESPPSTKRGQQRSSGCRYKVPALHSPRLISPRYSTQPGVSGMRQPPMGSPKIVPRNSVVFFFVTLFFMIRWRNWVTEGFNVGVNSRQLPWRSSD